MEYIHIVNEYINIYERIMKEPNRLDLVVICCYRYLGALTAVIGQKEFRVSKENSNFYNKRTETLEKLMPKDIFHKYMSCLEVRNRLSHSNSLTELSELKSFEYLEMINQVISWCIESYFKDIDYSREFSRKVRLNSLKNNEIRFDIDITNLSEWIKQIYKKAGKANKEEVGIIVLDLEKCCQEIVRILLLERGIGVEIDEADHFGKRYKVEGKPYLSYLDYIIEKQPDYFPVGCLQFLKEIRDERNHFSHNIDYNGEAFTVCFQAFDAFVQWYYVYVKGNRDIYDQLCQVQLLTSNAAVLISTRKAQEVESINDLDYFASKCAMKLKAMLQPQFDRIENTMIDVKNKLSKIEESVCQIVDSIANYQELVERQLANCVSKEEWEKLMGRFTDECIERINETFRIENDKRQYDLQQEELQDELDYVWPKLTPESIKYLTTAKVVYYIMHGLQDKPDYSGVCILVTKAMELELHNRLFAKYSDYLQEKYNIEIANEGSQWPTCMINVRTSNNNSYYRRKREKEITMGSFPYIMGIFPVHDNREDVIAKRDHAHEEFLKYAREQLFVESYTESEIDEKVLEYAGIINDVTNRFRNPSAHKGKVNAVSAKRCLDYIVEVEQILGVFLDSFRY